MKIKKVLGLTLTLLIMASSAIFADGFKDSHKTPWAESSIKKMSALGYVGGFPDGSFRPTAQISRAEFIAIMNKMNGFTEEADISFKDIKVNHWAYGEIRRAVKAGYVSGFPDGTFQPNTPVTREQAAAIISNLYEFENKGQSLAIKDLKDVSPWALESVAKLMANGIIGGYEDGSFGGKKAMNRAECIVTFDRTITKGVSLKELAETGKSFEDLKKPEEQKPQENQGGGGSAGGSGSSQPTLGQSLQLAKDRLNGPIMNDLTTDKQKETAGVIASSIGEYLKNSNYNIDKDVADAKENLKSMSQDEYAAFKDRILYHIPINHLDALDKVFGDALRK